MNESEVGEPWLDLYQYWLGKHRAGKPPSRGALDPPIEIPRLVGRIMLIDVAGEDFRYRLIGSRITRAMNVDLTGQVAGDTGWTSPGIAESWHGMLVAVRDRGRPLLVVTSLPRASVAHSHCIALPLVDATGQVEQIMVGVYYGGDVGTKPDIAGLTILEINPRAPLTSP
jgi:hypothetical protein